MRKRMIAGILSFLMIFMACAGNTEAVSAKEAAEENQKEEEKAEKTEVISEGTIDYIETEEDVPIFTTDVPVTTIEWGDDGEEEKELPGKMTRDGTMGESHDLVLVLDCSGSMSGTPVQEMKKACNNFVDDILDEDPKARIAIVGYASGVSVNTFGGSYFTSNRSKLRSAIAGLGASGSTAMNAGLVKADELLQNEGIAEHQYIIQMTDGEPNVGEKYTGSGAKYAGTSFVDPDGNSFTYSSTEQKAYCSEIYNTFSAIQSSYHMYSMGFFHSLSGTTKQFVATFLNDIQNTYYVEVGDADDITFSFEGIAADINSEHIKLNMDSVNLTEGDHTRLIATLDESMPEGTEISYGSSDTTVAVIDENGTITAKKAGTCTITVEAGGYSTSCEVTITAKPVLRTYSTYTVYQNENTQDRPKDDYKLCGGATIIYNGETYTTDQKGEVKLPDGQGGELTISKDGYTSRTISMKDLENGAAIYLQKDSGNPVVNSVMFNGSDVLADDYAMSLTETDSTTVSVDVDWGNSSRKSIKLVQEATAVEFEAEKNALTMVLKDRFDVSKDLYILATDQNDHSVKKKLNISAEGGIKGLDGLSFSAGGSISLTVPESVPLIKGQEVSLDLDNLAMLPFTVTVDQGIVNVTFGVDIFSYSKSQSKVTNTTTGFSRKVSPKTENEWFFQKLKNIKNNGIKDSINDLKNLKTKYKNQMKFPKGSFGFDADFTLLGYAEGYVDKDANFQWLDGGMVFNPSASVNWSGQFAIGPVPCYWEAEIAGAIEAAINLYKSKTEKAATLMPDGSVEGELSGSVGAGIGINKVATIGGGATLKAEPGVTFYQNKENYLKCTFSGSLYFKIKLGIIEYKPESEPISCTIDNSPKRSAAAASFSDDQSVMYDLSKYKVESLEYILDDSPAPQALSAAMEEGTNSEYAGITDVIDENSYTTTNPKVVSTGTHTRLAVWLNTETADVNDVQLYYSYYNGNGWSAPAKISDDGTFDYAPKVCAVNGRAYVIWQNAEQRFDADVLESETVAEQLAAHMGITVAEFKTSDEKFTVTDLSRESGYIDVQPVIAANGSTAAAYWVENAENDWFGQNSKNTIYKAEYDGSGWSEAAPLVSDVNSVCSIAAGYMDSGFHVAYTMDSDNDLTDSSDTELYVDGAPITGNDVLESAPAFEEGILYWSSGGRIMSLTTLQGGDVQSILPDGVTIPADVFRILSDGNRKVILYLQAGADAVSEIYGLVSTAEGWSTPVQITDNGQCISDFDALWLGEGIELLCNMTAVNGLETDAYGNQVIGDSTYGKTSLVRMNYRPCASLAVDGCYYEKSEIGAGCTLPITVEVTNTGMADFNGVKAEVLDTEGASVYSTELRETVGAGKTAELEFGYIVKKKDLGKTYTVKCTPLSEDGEEVYGGDALLELSYEDLELTFANWGLKDDKTAVILAQAANAGFSSLSDVAATLYKVEEKKGDGTDGENNKTEVARIEPGSVKPGEDAPLSFSVDYEQGAVYYLELTAAEKEQNTANNSAYLYFEPARDNSGRTISGIKAVKKVTEYTVGSTLDLSDLKVTASYEDGTVSDIRSDCVIDTSGVKMNTAGTYLIQVSYENLKTAVTIKVKNAGNGTSSGNKGAAVGTTVTRDGIVYEVKASQGGKREAAVKKAGKSALAKAKIPASVTIEKANYNVTEIRANAFKNCRKLKSVSIGKNITSIGASAFEGCTSLKKLSIPSKVASIGKKAFSKNSKLTDVTIGASVKSIGASAFAGDKKLKKILIKSKKLKTIGKGAIKGISSKAVIKVPKAKRAALKKLFKAKTGYRKTMKIKG